jgi:hypothetical protein
MEVCLANENKKYYIKKGYRACQKGMQKLKNRVC